MKYGMLIWAGLCRRKARTILTMLSVVIAFLLFGLLHGMNQGMNGVYTDLDVNRLFVQNKLNMTDGLPIAYLERIKKVPGVTAVTHWTNFRGFYQNAQNKVSAYATDVTAQFQVFSRLEIPPEQLLAMERTRGGVIVDQETAAEYGWKIGDRIPISSTLWAKKTGGNSYDFEIVGIADTSAYGGSGQPFPSVYIHYQLLDEMRAFSSGLIHLYIATIDDPHKGTEISNAIDALFANSSYETLTQSEQVWGQQMIRQLGDISVIANSVVGAVLFTLLFLTGTTMMQSVRERTAELATLKALGFTDIKIVSLVLTESLILCLLASVVGLTLASVWIDAGLKALFGDVSLPTGMVQLGIGLAVVLAVMSGIPPAWRAARLNTVDGLAGR